VTFGSLPVAGLALRSRRWTIRRDQHRDIGA